MTATDPESDLEEQISYIDCVWLYTFFMQNEWKWINCKLINLIPEEVTIPMLQFEVFKSGIVISNNEIRW